MFIPHTQQEKKEMLETVGVSSLDDLFQDVPPTYRFPKLDLPPAMTEMEIRSLLEDISSNNETAHNLICFLGAGAYNHYIPAAVDSIISRGEFYTAYTPYQPEISQGTLQAIFEYQSLICGLTGMEACNASHYDGATATAEAVVMAYHNFRQKRSKVVLSPSIHPQYRAAVRTYMQAFEDLDIVGDQVGQDPFTPPDSLAGEIDEQTALVVIQYPDFFGRIFDLTRIVEKAHAAGALVCIVVNPISLALIKPPSEFGADIVVGDGQPLGIPLSYGGPYLGIFASKKEYVRKIAGRLVGETIDARGQRAYVLTLTAREQHIRREKATSNICTNQSLMALTSTVYMSLLGKQGLRQVAELCYHNAHYAAQMIAKIPGYSIPADAPFFHEFPVRCPRPVEEINQALLEHGILGGYSLEQDYPGLKNHMLLAVTEMNTREEIDFLGEVLEEAYNA